MGRGRGRPKKSVSASPQIRSVDGTVHTVETIQSDGEDGEILSGSTRGKKVGEATPQVKQTETLIPETEQEKKDTQRKLWVDVLSDNRNHANGLTMEYVAPKVVDGEIEIEIEEKDIESELRYWDSALILYALGGDISMNMLKHFMERMWNFVQLPEMVYQEEGYFILKFRSHSDKDDVLMKGPYTLRNMPLLIRDWTPGFSLKEDMLRTLPIWVKLPHLPLHLWGVRSLNKIGSALGNPLVTNECTASKARVSYARILVEVDVTQDLKEVVTIKDVEGKKLQQMVECEWKPLFCDKCQKFGHKCKEKAVRKWKPKLPEQEKKTVQEPETLPTKSVVTTLMPDPEVKRNEDISIEDLGKEWETVLNGRDRGKQSIQEHVVTTCLNGFAALGDWNNPLVGINKTGKLREVSSRLKEIRQRITVLLETRVKENKAKDVRQLLLSGGMFVDNYTNHFNGRIWISWDVTNVDIRVRHSTSQLIHCALYDNQGVFLYWITTVYASNSANDICRLWKDIENINRNQQGPWVVVGDFNNATKLQDRIGGKRVTQAEIKDLIDMMNVTELSEMDSTRQYFTWSNNQLGNTIYSRIDRVIANADWFQLHMDTTLYVIHQGVSDHAMLWIKAQGNLNT
ncbi:uncharacterized protein LOC131604751 [Vicia villosa]|uniref:uncharacterized protein LOC131604751 n=1 Tax=Vicia villosa TaxID=3911 RepID=UPI00273BC4D4|nr:uncharacterized protein LOC131604751 [Vicia villosa]